jgi:hypothetical protein
MKKLKSILQSLNISDEIKEKLYSFFESRLRNKQLIFPQEISNEYGVNENLISRLVVQLTNEDLLEVYTVPYDKQNNYKPKIEFEGVLLKFSDDIEILNEDLEPYDNTSLEAIAAYRVVTI